MRAELLETAIIADVKNMFRDEQFMARLWEEANKRLGAEKPDLEKEIARIEAQMAKTQGAIDRYFEAFEAGTLKAELCNEKVRNLRTRMEELEGEKRGLEARRERLKLPAIDREMLASIMDNFEKVMAEGPNPKNKHLLHQLVKKVLIHSRETVEIWYALPNSQRFANCNTRLTSLGLYKKPITEREKKKIEHEKRTYAIKRLLQDYDRKVLYEQVWSEPALTVAKGYGVSSVCLGKVCRQLNVPVPPRGYWAERAKRGQGEEATPAGAEDEVKSKLTVTSATCYLGCTGKQRRAVPSTARRRTRTRMGFPTTPRGYSLSDTRWKDRIDFPAWKRRWMTARTYRCGIV
ncbi:MAG: hypothetical protein IH628_13585 [Proteobacteria bacterium]|nr:hypothetical protein [Pseudomonadota bacterium]